MAELTIEGRMYPIGIQSFPEIVEKGYTYVDKTFFVAKLVKESKYVFLSRPRRFGKSLLLSTIHTYFEGLRELFKGLAIDSMDVDWTPRPVLYLNLNSGRYKQPGGLEKRLTSFLFKYEKLYEIEPQIEDDVVLRFENLISEVYEKTGKRVVILVDEYDKPLLELDDNPELFEYNQSLLKEFFSNLKSMDDYIEFGMLTGVARFSKVSIFSDLNNLDDISMVNDYADICGWTEKELTDCFDTGIKRLADVRKEEKDSTLKELRDFYDGYLFAPKGSRLYNPFSVLKALKYKDIQPYWFETGTPTFLVNRIKRERIDPESLNGQTQSYSELIAVGLGTTNVIALMFQTGYLTIDSYDPRSQLYILRFPNWEVEVAFAQNLLPLFVPATNVVNSPFNINKFKLDLYHGDPKAFMERLESLFKDLPGEDHHESTYRAVTYLLCILSGTDAIPERHSYKGRSDLEVLTPDSVYLFEFKYNKSLHEAMDQIYSRDYAGRYRKDPRKIWLIGANYVEKKDERRLEYHIEEMIKH